MNRTEGMLRRRVKRIELQRAVARIDDVVPRARGNENGVTSVNARPFLQIVAAGAKINLSPAALYTDKLVNVSEEYLPMLSRLALEPLPLS